MAAPFVTRACARIGETSVVKPRFSVCAAISTSLPIRVFVQRLAVDDQRLRIRALQLDGARHEAFDRIGDVVRLVEHVGRPEVRRLGELGFHELVEHEEQAERLDGARVEIVVAVLRIVEMEAAEPLRMHQARDDHFDVHVRRVVAEIDEAERLGPERLRRHERAAPVLDDGRVERGLVHLVLDEHAPVVGQRRVDLLLRFEIAIERAAEMRLAGKIGAVADPHRERLRAELLAGGDAVDVVRDRLGANRRVGVREAAVLVRQRLSGLILERVRVHRIEPEPERGAVFAQRLVVVGRDPRAGAAIPSAWRPSVCG